MNDPKGIEKNSEPTAAVGPQVDQYQLGLNAEYRFLDKWGEDVLRTGFTSIPNFVLRINRYVSKSKKIKSSEMFVIITLLTYWWDNYRMPFPSITRISQDTNISTRQVKRIIRKLEDKEYLEINKTKGRYKIDSNIYDISNLVKLIKRIAKHEISKNSTSNKKSIYDWKINT